MEMEDSREEKDTPAKILSLRACFVRMSSVSVRRPLVTRREYTEKYAHREVNLNTNHDSAGVYPPRILIPSFHCASVAIPNSTLEWG